MSVSDNLASKYKPSNSKELEEREIRKLCLTEAIRLASMSDNVLTEEKILKIAVAFEKYITFGDK